MRGALVPPVCHAARRIDGDETDRPLATQLGLYREMSRQGGLAEPALLRSNDQNLQPARPPNSPMSRHYLAAAARGSATGSNHVHAQAYCPLPGRRSEEHTSELQSLMRISYAVFCLKQQKNNTSNNRN